MVTARKRVFDRFRRSTLGAYVTSGLFIAIAVASIATSETTADRLPLPTDTVARQVIAEVQDVFRKEYATANTPQEKSALAKQLASAAQKNANPLERWGMLSEAGRLAADAGDVETAFAVVASLAEGFATDRMTLELEAIGRMATRATPPVARDLAKRTIAICTTLMSNQAFDEAKHVADIMPKLLVKARDRTLSTEFRTLKSRIDSQMKAAEEQAQQEQAFSRKRSRMVRLATESMDDPDACLEAGQFFCFEANDWDTGLPLLAGGADKELAAVAQSEVEAKDGYQLYDAADRWTKWAEGQKDEWKAPGLDRSILILTNLTKLATGLDKIRIEKRLSEVQAMRKKVRGRSSVEEYILDFAPGAAAAYSLRNLSLSYIGPVVTVRRSTDTAEADFTASEVSDGTLAAWCGGGDGFVAQWWDQSGNARHATASGTAQPQIVDSGVLVTEGGKAAVRFDGGDDYLLTANIGAFQASAGVGLFAVFSKDIASTSDTFTTTNPEYIASVLNSLGSTVDAKILWRILGGRVEYVRRNAANSAYITTRAESHAVAASQYMQSVVGGLAANLYLDGAELALSDDQSGDSLSSATSYICIGSQDGSFRFLDGTISELLIYPTDQTALRTRIEGNLSWYY